MTDDKKVDDEELVDFDDDEEKEKETKPTEAGKGTYVAVNIAGFRDFLLKPELNGEGSSAILGQDIIAQAKSGMGKTAVFVLSTLHQLEETDEKFVQCMVMIKREYVRFAKYIPFAKIAVFFGGTPIGKDKETLRKGSEDFPNIVLGKVKFFVLDEADRLLEKLDMRRDVQEVFTKCPTAKQVMMFSATLPKDIRETAKKFMKDPLEIYVDSQSKLTLHGLQQYFVNVDERQKNRKLTDLLDSLEFNQVVIFVRSRDRCEQLHMLLRECGFPSTMIHGSMTVLRREGFGGGGAQKATLARGTKGLAISFITDERAMPRGNWGGESLSDKECLSQVQERFEVDIKTLPDKISVDSYMQS